MTTGGAVGQGLHRLFFVAARVICPRSRAVVEAIDSPSRLQFGEAGMPDESDIAEAVDHTEAGAAPPLRGANGAINPDFVELVEQAVEAGDAGLLRTLVGELHESDVGDLIEA